MAPTLALTVVAHAATVQSWGNMNFQQDMRRPLSYIGVIQAKKWPEKFNTGNTRFTFAGSSLATRCRETVRHIVGPAHPIVPIPQMGYDPTQESGAKISKALASIGNASLSDYITRFNALIPEHGKVALDAVKSAVIANLPTNHPEDITALVCGHAPLIAAFGLAAINENSVSDYVALDRLHSTPFGEMEGVTIVWNGAEITRFTFNFN